MPDGEHRRELANFLRTRRERIAPSEVGLKAGPRRRTPGLRREEVADLAGVGTAWYTWLEQGRDIRVSTETLDSLACALRLGPDERTHLFTLAHPETLRVIVPPRDETVTPSLQRMLDNLKDSPAYLAGRRWDILAWNRAAALTFTDYSQIPIEHRNNLWLVFAYPPFRTLLAEWEKHARAVLSQFRVDSGRYAGDPQFAALIAELSEISPEFREWWPRHEVRGRTEGCKILQHPTAGRMALEYSAFTVGDNPDMKLVVFTPLCEDNSVDKMNRLLA
ncbi:transcriptional regulator [Capsulimonas corticalis]|uniref:Transcriptional regulator n=1 Tax=Capsulimonas corticalis TaxID=2219043 RepID=A0A402CRP2_9BACT|nr:helix-turn-helix transcriptional regulator [Capsulimonas corticalis]BDI28084.1 transcriptional regulator [Capsulimonas corticalis]